MLKDFLSDFSDLIIKEYSKTNIKVLLFKKKYLIIYCDYKKDKVLKFFSTNKKDEMIKAWMLTRSLFIICKHPSYLRSEKDLLSDDYSLYKEHWKIFN